MKLPDRYQKALDEFTLKYKKDKNVIGILLTGSFVHSTPHENSDLDVHIILAKSKFRERGNTWINGIEVEYFINPVEQIEDYFKHEVNPHTAHMFANSFIVFERNDKLKKLIKKAKLRLKKRPPALPDLGRELGKYHLDDLEKDLLDVYKIQDEFSFNKIAIDILGKSLNLFYDLNRVEQEKSKRLYNFLKNIDKKFATTYRRALLEGNMKKKKDALIKLIRIIEDKLDGKRAKEWALKSKCPMYNKK